MLEAIWRCYCEGCYAVKGYNEKFIKRKTYIGTLIVVDEVGKKIPKVAAYCVFLPIKKSMSKVLSHRYTII